MYESGQVLVSLSDGGISVPRVTQQSSGCGPEQLELTLNSAQNLAGQDIQRCFQN